MASGPHGPALWDSQTLFSYTAPDQTLALTQNPYSEKIKTQKTVVYER